MLIYYSSQLTEIMCSIAGIRQTLGYMINSGYLPQSRVFISGCELVEGGKYRVRKVTPIQQSCL